MCPRSFNKPARTIPFGGGGAVSRNVVVLSLAFFLLKGGEELWNGFLPKYLEALGASALIIGLFGALKDLLDAVYQYPGGVWAERVGSQRALLTANALALAGYVVYLLAPSALGSGAGGQGPARAWPLVFAGVFLVMAWESFSVPATFTLIGQSLPERQRARGFSLQSTLRRLPILVAPPVGGWLIAHWGVVGGVRRGLVVTLVLGAAALLLQKFFYAAPAPGPRLPAPGPHQAWPLELRRLLVADILARLAEGISEIFLVLYFMNVVGLDPVRFGSLITVQMLTAILSYLPGGRLGDRLGRFPLVLATFLFFALFPLAVLGARGYAGAVLAFVVGGLRELGEPARKALITDLSAGGRDVGLYYLLRGLAVAPAALLGGWLWQQQPWLPFAASGAVGLCGVLFYASQRRLNH